MTTDTTLDPFETALLRELQTTAARMPAAEVTPIGARHHRRTWAAVAATVAVATVGAIGLHAALAPKPAFAVGEASNGAIDVTVTRLEGAPALERALRDHGIAADITYLPPGKECAPGRYHDVSPSGLSLSVGANMFEVKIPAGTVADGDTLVLSASVQPNSDGTGATSQVSFGLAQGPVAACTVIDSPTSD